VVLSSWPSPCALGACKYSLVRGKGARDPYHRPSARAEMATKRKTIESSRRRKPSALQDATRRQDPTVQAGLSQAFVGALLARSSDVQQRELYAGTAAAIRAAQVVLSRDIPPRSTYPREFQRALEEIDLETGGLSAGKERWRELARNRVQSAFALKLPLPLEEFTKLVRAAIEPWVPWSQPDPDPVLAAIRKHVEFDARLRVVRGDPDAVLSAALQAAGASRTVRNWWGDATRKRKKRAVAGHRRVSGTK
jgi:hypothetical protein